MKKVLYKLLSNKYLWLILFFLRNIIATAHDCSSPGDCEETAGYNAAVAIVGGAVALGVGLMGAGFTTTVSDGDETQLDEEVPVEEIEENEELKEPPVSPEDQGIKDEDIDDFVKEFLEEDKESDDIIVEEDEDDIKVEDEEEDNGVDEIKEEKNKVNKIENEDQEQPNKIAHDAVGFVNAARTLIEKIGIKKWEQLVRSKELAKATKNFYDKIKNLKSKGLSNLVKKYAEKLNHKLRWKAELKAMGKAKKMGKFMDKLGKAGDALDIFVSIDKVFHTKGDGYDKTGKAAEEILRFGLKKYFGKFPPVAIADAVSTLLGGPNMDVIIDKGLDTYKDGVTKVTKYVYTKPKTDDDKFYDVLKRRKSKINSLKISDAEKRKRIKKVYKILKKNPRLWK